MTDFRHLSQEQKTKSIVLQPSNWRIWYLKTRSHLKWRIKTRRIILWSRGKGWRNSADKTLGISKTTNSYDSRIILIFVLVFSLRLQMAPPSCFWRTLASGSLLSAKNLWENSHFLSSCSQWRQGDYAFLVVSGSWHSLTAFQQICLSASQMPIWMHFDSDWASSWVCRPSCSPISTSSDSDLSSWCFLFCWSPGWIYWAPSGTVVGTVCNIWISVRGDTVGILWCSATGYCKVWGIHGRNTVAARAQFHQPIRWRICVRVPRISSAVFLFSFFSFHVLPLTYIYWMPT